MFKRNVRRIHASKTRVVKKNSSPFSFKNILIVAGLVAALWFAKSFLFQTANIFEVAQVGSPFQQAIVLDGASYLTASNSGTLSPNMTTGFAAEAWVRPATATFSASRIIDKTSGSVNDFSISMDAGYNSGEDKYYVNYYLLVGTNNCLTPYSLFNQRVYAGSEKDQITSWHHVAGVIHPGGKLDIFVDGQASTVNTNSIPSTCTTSGLPITIGARQLNANAADGFFKGEIDELRISNGEPYVGNFVPSKRPYDPSPGLALMYHFNGDTVDAGSARHDGIVTGTVSYAISTVPTPAPSVLPSPSPSSNPGIQNLNLSEACGDGGFRYIAFTCKNGVNGNSGNGSQCYNVTEALEIARIACGLTPPTPSTTPTPTPQICTQEAGTCVTKNNTCFQYRNGCEKNLNCAVPFKTCASPKPVPSASPIPPGCYYQQPKCVKAPCNAILVCPPSPTPTPTPSPVSTPNPKLNPIQRLVCTANCFARRQGSIGACQNKCR